MFAFGAFVLVGLLAWVALRQGRKDHESQAGGEFIPLVIRQEMKLALYLLAAILIAVGAIADRVY